MQRLKETHKGDYGHLFIVGGSPGLTGAVSLAGEAAMRSGCGLVTIAIPKTLNMIIATKLTEVMTLPLPETFQGTISPEAVKIALNFASAKADAVLIGPGISTHKESAEFVKTFIAENKKFIVIDADALRIISSDKSLTGKIGNKIICTPHPGEMSSLTGLSVKEIQNKREYIAKSFAAKYNITVVLKGYRTVITDGEKICINLTGNPGMATAGSGDVLAGIIGSFVAQGYPIYEAARYGTYIHGLAGDLAAKELGEDSLIASDIIKKLPDAFRFSKKERLTKRVKEDRL